MKILMQIADIQIYQSSKRNLNCLNKNNHNHNMYEFTYIDTLLIIINVIGSNETKTPKLFNNNENQYHGIHDQKTTTYLLY